MANNQYVNKVVFGNDTLIDLTNDTAGPGHIVSGYTAHDKSGAPITGIIPYQTGTALVFNFIENAPDDTDKFLAVTIPAGYYSYGALKINTIQIPVPQTGTNNVIIKVPNGTSSPDPSDDDDWIPITFSVDSSGNSNIVDDTIPATGVSF